MHEVVLLKIASSAQSSPARAAQSASFNAPSWQDTSREDASLKPLTPEFVPEPVEFVDIRDIQPAHYETLQPLVVLSPAFSSHSMLPACETLLLTDSGDVVTDVSPFNVTGMKLCFTLFRTNFLAFNQPSPSSVVTKVSASRVSSNGLLNE